MYMETGVNLLFFHTIKLHLKYIHKVLNMPQYRLPYILTKHIIKRNIFWYAGLERLNKKHNLQLTPQNIASKNINTIIHKTQQTLISITRNTFINSIQNLKHYTQYKTLNTTLGDYHYIQTIHDRNSLQYLFKLRCELLNLNKKKMQ